jgi:CheY-like chemotaxis protein
VRGARAAAPVNCGSLRSRSSDRHSAASGMKALIVDDEPLARREPRRLLAPFSWVEIVGEASDVEEARERVDALLPDVVFLDVEVAGSSC